MKTRLDQDICVCAAVVIWLASNPVFADNNGFFDKDFVKKGFSSDANHNSSTSGDNAPVDSWSLTPSTANKSITTKGQYSASSEGSPATDDSWSLNNRDENKPNAMGTIPAAQQIKHNDTWKSGDSWNRKDNPSGGPNTTTTLPREDVREQDDSPKTAPDIQRHITSIMDQLKSGRSGNDLHDKVDSLSTYVTERVKQSTNPDVSPAPILSPTSVPTKPIVAPIPPANITSNRLQSAPNAVGSQTSKQRSPSVFEMRSPTEPIVQNPDDRQQKGGVPAVLSLVVSNSSQEQVLKNIETLVKIHKQQEVPVGEILIVGTPSLKSFFDPSIWKLFDDMEQEGIIVRPVLAPPKRLNITRSPAWVVRYNGEDYVYEAEQSPNHLFNAHGMFLGADRK